MTALPYRWVSQKATSEPTRLPSVAATTTATKGRVPWEASAPPSGTTISLEMGIPALSEAIVTKMARMPPELIRRMSREDTAAGYQSVGGLPAASGQTPLTGFSALAAASQTRHECVAGDLGTEADRKVQAGSQKGEEALAVDAQQVGGRGHRDPGGRRPFELRRPSSPLEAADDGRPEDQRSPPSR